jgi:hypothetical protein
MRELVQHLHSTLGIAVVEQSSAWQLIVPKPDGLTFEISVPFAVLEWFVSARDSTGELWADWVDYYATNGETPEALKASMASDIERFVSVLAAVPVRRTGRKSSIEWRRNEAWHQVAVSAV